MAGGEACWRTKLGYDATRTISRSSMDPVPRFFVGEPVREGGRGLAGEQTNGDSHVKNHSESSRGEPLLPVLRGEPIREGGLRLAGRSN
jgi:hypothetical protein